MTTGFYVIAVNTIGETFAFVAKDQMLQNAQIIKEGEHFCIF